MTGELDPKLVTRINAEHLIETQLEPADLAFVFGSRWGVPEFVDTIVDLWERGYCRRILISGGATPGGSETEADVIAAQVALRGIPNSALLLERTATNCGENVTLSLPILEREIGLANISSLIAVGMMCTSRRYLMTLERHWPQVRKMLVTVNQFGVPRGVWHMHAQSRDRILSEWRKIEPYLAQDFIRPWPPLVANKQQEGRQP